MKKLLKKNQKIYVAPENVKGALSSFIKKTEKNIIEVEIKAEDLKYYKKDESVEVFTVVDEGMLYFRADVENVDKETGALVITFDKKNYEIIQRREFTRIELEKEFTLKDGSEEYICKTLDLSAGGMKIMTEAPLSTEKDYVIEFSLESNIPIECYFKPIRVTPVSEKSQKTKNVVSGKFIALKNIDKIAIVQFCFKKQMENTNK